MAAEAKGPTSKYAVRLDELERSAHVPLDEQTTEVPEPPAPEPLDGPWGQQLANIRYAGA